MKTSRIVVVVTLLVALALVAAGCAGANIVETDDGAGFWRGLAHGLIAPITFVIALFRDDVGMYDVHNNGGWYNLGFLLGLGCWHGGGRAAYQRGWRRGRRDAERELSA